MASTHSALVVPTDTTTLESRIPMSAGTPPGFIISLCMVENCLIYADTNVNEVYIYHNHNITEIPANAFLGATYLKVSWVRKLDCIDKYRVNTNSIHLIDMFLGKGFASMVLHNQFHRFSGSRITEHNVPEMQTRIETVKY